MIETAVRPKRVSTRCVAKTERQLKLLEEAYENDTRPDETAFEAHATETGLDVAQVKRWFTLRSQRGSSSDEEEDGWDDVEYRPSKRQGAIGREANEAEEAVDVLDLPRTRASRSFKPAAESSPLSKAGAPSAPSTRSPRPPSTPTPVPPVTRGPPPSALSFSIVIPYLKPTQTTNSLLSSSSSFFTAAAMVSGRQGGGNGTAGRGREVVKSRARIYTPTPPVASRSSLVPKPSIVEPTPRMPLTKPNNFFDLDYSLPFLPPSFSTPLLSDSDVLETLIPFSLAPPLSPGLTAALPPYLRSPHRR